MYRCDLKKTGALYNGLIMKQVNRSCLTKIKRSCKVKFKIG